MIKQEPLLHILCINRVCPPRKQPHDSRVRKVPLAVTDINSRNLEGVFAFITRSSRARALSDPSITGYRFFRMVGG